MQELACAVHHSKPLVPVIMDQAAWHLLTTPRGAEEVLQDPGCGLADYLGRPLLEGQPLSEDALRELYWQLSAINFCPCRQEDVASMGVVEVVRNLQTYIGKDIPYLKVSSPNPAPLSFPLGTSYVPRENLPGELANPAYLPALSRRRSIRSWTGARGTGRPGVSPSRRCCTARKCGSGRRGPRWPTGTGRGRRPTRCRPPTWQRRSAGARSRSWRAGRWRRWWERSCWRRWYLRA